MNAATFSHTRRALVIGGSMAGMFAAALLQRAGWVVDLFERSDVELSGRGAGIVTHDELLQALRDAGASLKDLGVQVHERLALGPDGEPIERLAYPQLVTSWDRLHSLMRATIPQQHHHLGCHLSDVTQDAHGVTAVFANGRTERADLLVGADGFRSGVRARYLPEIVPEYAGYVVWRGLADERSLDARVHAAIFEKFTFYLPPHNEVIGYPIAGSDNDLRIGQRRFNWVWYRRVSEEALAPMLVDEDGVQHAVSIPPPRIRQALIDALKADALGFLPWPFYEVLLQIERPFFTPIYDHLSPSMVFGRVVLVGDAACVGRPHIGMGVTKAADDARCLAQCLRTDGGLSLAQGLARFEAERLPAARQAFLCGRALGEYMHHDASELSQEQRASWSQRHGVAAMLRHTASSAYVRDARV